MGDEIKLPAGGSPVVQTKAIKTLAEVEKEHIMGALELFQGNKTKAAEALDISLKTLYNKLNSYKKD